jgi:flagellar hook-associated protein 2
VTSEPATLAVGRDYARLADGVDAFVNAYNDLARQLRELTFYDPATRTKGKLQGDATVIAIQNRIRTALRGVSDDPASQYRRLSDIGVSFQADATLKLDRTRLETALKNDPDGVIALFVGAGQNPTSTARSSAGVAGLLSTLTGEALGSEGVFAKRAESIGRGVARIDQEQERFERRLEVIEKRYLQQYSGLDKMLAGFSSISTYLAYL